jgi:hypothetical protein
MDAQGIELSLQCIMLTLLYADYQVISSNSEAEFGESHVICLTLAHYMEWKFPY